MVNRQLLGVFARGGGMVGLVSLVLYSAPFLSAQSTIDETDRYAWSANAGWFNFRPSAADGVVTGEAFLSRSVWGANIGWIRLGDGSPANGYAYANTSASDYGVNHDGLGNLSGFAYGANVGWINFGWTTLNDPNRPRFSLVNGDFAGYAYGANIGWVNLGAGYLTTNRIEDTDSDSDGMSDPWEMEHFGSLGVAGIGTNQDHDGESDASECAADTDPNDPDEYLQILIDRGDYGEFVVTLVFATTKPTRFYRIEHDDDYMEPWTDSDLGLFSPDPGGETTKTLTFAEVPRFFRVVVERPLQP